MTSLRKQVALCTIGTMLEWYDFSLFAFLAPVLAILFFPQSNHFAAMMSTFTVFASGFVMRPLGALFFGHLGDTLGRKYALLITIFSMAFATTAIGLIPLGYSFSMIILVICRLLQGFATSGDYPGGLALLAEQNSRKHKSFVASFGVITTGAGGLLGALVYAILLKTLGYAAIVQWAWRIPFLLGAPLGIFGYLLRRYTLESSQFEFIKQQKTLCRTPVLQLFKTHSRTLLAMLCISILTNTVIYLDLIYFGSAALSTHKLDASQVMYLNLAVMVFYTLSMVVFGFLADYFDKRILLITACGILLLTIYPLFTLIFSASVVAQFAAQIFIAALVGMVLAPFASVLAESFPTAVRYTGLSVTLNIAAAFFGGSAPVVCGWLTKISGSPLTPAFYILLLTAFAFCAGLFTVQNASTKLVAETN